jgi:hypothetical protein
MNTVLTDFRSEVLPPFSGFKKEGHNKLIKDSLLNEILLAILISMIPVFILLMMMKAIIATAFHHF